MSETLARKLEHPRARVDCDDARAGPFRDVVGELTLPTADVEHALSSLNAVDEEVVVARQAMFRMDAFVVLDGAEVGRDVGVLVDLQQLTHRLALVTLRAHDSEPQLE